MNLYAYSARDLVTEGLPGPSSALLRMADAPDLLVPVPAGDEERIRLKDLIFNDARDDCGLVRAPGAADAAAILDWYRQVQAEGIPHFVAQCQAGVGRSQAVVAALGTIEGRDVSAIKRHGTYNRTLCQLMLEAAGRVPEPEPLVSMVVRCKYAPWKADAFLLSMRAQRYENWEVVLVTDGEKIPRDSVGYLWPNVNWIPTPEARGRWGHPYRQLGLDAARGDYIGMSNDDNYYVPGYLEQMVYALESSGADVALCPCLHSYSGWSVVPPSDLGCWIARRDVVRAHPWPGVEWDSDREYLRLLATGRKVATVNRPLFVHN